MGIDLNTARFLAWSRTRGVDFAQTAMLGRQTLMGGTPFSLVRAASRHPWMPFPSAEALAGARGYAEPLFHQLGAQEVHSYDASAYEGATHLWDLNEPPPVASCERYSAVFDGGTLEHVFDFPSALQGALRLLRPGGHYLAATPAHGWFGHGFYQFSAELFQQVFTPANGCELVALLMFEDRRDASFYEVLDPARAGGRHKFASLIPATLAVVARRTGVIPDRLRLQQSDYAAAWEAARGGPSAEAGEGISSGPGPGSRLAACLRRWGKARYLALGGNPFFDTRIYREMKLSGTGPAATITPQSHPS